MPGLPGCERASRVPMPSAGVRARRQSGRGLSCGADDPRARPEADRNLRSARPARAHRPGPPRVRGTNPLDVHRRAEVRGGARRDEMPALGEREFGAYLEESRQVVVGEIQRFVPKRGRLSAVLYVLVRDYPLRTAKALRPALCIATCRALGGRLEAVLRSAAVVELYHNAFLVHDDVEDLSE